MSQDVSHILDGWDFDPHELNVRVIKCKSGVEKLQMRVDLGVLQMEMDGRPDGRKPHGFDSFFDFYEKQATDYGEGYKLTEEALDELFREAVQYRQRYLCLFHLNRYEPVVRDTDRNLRLFLFVNQHSQRKRDRWRFDQHRPFVVMMHTRAKIMMFLDRGEIEHALAAIDAGCLAIEEFLAQYGKLDDESECFELEFLRRWRDELGGKGRPRKSDINQESMISKLLQEAVAREDYETAAVLRDQIKELHQQDIGS